MPSNSEWYDEAATLTCQNITHMSRTMQSIQPIQNNANFMMDIGFMPAIID